MLKNFINAVQFLTVFTLSKKHRIEEGDLARSVVYFPIVGFLIGFILVNADKLFLLIVLPQSIGNMLLVVLSVLITRALHTDGLADACDGLMGGRSPEARLAIMKDSRLGTAGALAILFSVLIKYLCFNNLFEGEKIAALLTAPMLGRWSQTIMVFNVHYGREEGMARAFVGHLRSSGMAAVSAVAVGLTVFVNVRLEPRTVYLALSVLLGVLGLTALGKRYAVRKFGGVTGDAIGAVNELNEMLVLLLFVIFAS